MKGLMFMVAVLGLGAAAVMGTGAGASSDASFERTIDRPPAEVYEAFSEATPDGERSASGSSAWDHEMTARTTKVAGESINQEILIDGRTAFTIRINFAPAAEGTATRFTAEADAEEDVINDTIAKEMGPRMRFSQSRFETFFDRAMEELAQSVESGQALAAFDVMGMGLGGSGGDASDPDLQRAASHQARGSVVRPDVRPTAAVDPDAIAEAHREGRTSNSRSRY